MFLVRYNVRIPLLPSLKTCIVLLFFNESFVTYQKQKRVKNKKGIVRIPFSIPGSDLKKKKTNREREC